MILRPLSLAAFTLSVGFLFAGCGQQTPVAKTTVAVKGVSGGVRGG